MSPTLGASPDRAPDGGGGGVAAPIAPSLEQLRSALQDAVHRHRPSVAYYYRPLIIEEWVAPDARAAVAGSDAL